MFKLRITGDLGFEVWKDIPGYEGSYQASTYGRIRSKDRVVHMGNGVGSDRIIKGKIRKQLLDKNGKYYRVTISIKRQVCKYSIHRLIALTFPEICGDCFEGATVDHLDGNRFNNNAFNLKFKTFKENIYNPATFKKAIVTSLKNLEKANTKEAKEKAKIARQKAVRCVDTGKEYEDRFAASYQTGISAAGIWKCCKGKSKTCGGYVWEYV